MPKISTRLIADQIKLPTTPQKATLRGTTITFPRAFRLPKSLAVTSAVPVGPGWRIYAIPLPMFERIVMRTLEQEASATLTPNTEPSFDDVMISVFFRSGYVRDLTVTDRKITMPADFVSGIRNGTLWIGRQKEFLTLNTNKLSAV